VSIVDRWGDGRLGISPNNVVADQRSTINDQRSVQRLVAVTHQMLVDLRAFGNNKNAHMNNATDRADREKSLRRIGERVELSGMDYRVWFE